MVFSVSLSGFGGAAGPVTLWCDDAQRHAE
jgi:hypothetical protein